LRSLRLGLRRAGFVCFGLAFAGFRFHARDRGSNDPDATAGNDSELVQAAMADLFVAADRLQYEPGNWFFLNRRGDGGATVMSSRPPYGIAPRRGRVSSS
jgi:hypothetical protein